MEGGVGCRSEVCKGYSVCAGPLRNWACQAIIRFSVYTESRVWILGRADVAVTLGATPSSQLTWGTGEGSERPTPGVF
jgi:hypothetical protein